jgi:hypothetical protein
MLLGYLLCAVGLLVLFGPNAIVGVGLILLGGICIIGSHNHTMDVRIGQGLENITAVLQAIEKRLARDRY